MIDTTITKDKQMKSNRKGKESSYPKVRCWKCNAKFRSDVSDAKKSMFVCHECNKG